MLVVATFLVVIAFMGIVAAVSMSGDRERRAKSPPPIPRPVPPDLDTGIHLRWNVRPSGPNPSPYVPPVDAAVGNGEAMREVAEAMDRRDYRAAADILRGAIAASTPGSGVALLRYRLAECLIELGAFVEADQVIDAALAQLDADIEGDLLCKRGEIAWAVGELDRAELTLEAASTKTMMVTGAAWIELHLGLVERDRGRLTEARRLLEAAGAAYDGGHDSLVALVHILLASVAVQAGELDGAYDQLEMAATHAPGDPFLPAYGRLIAARIARGRGDVEGAIALATLAADSIRELGLVPYLAEADLELARSHAASGNVKEANAAYWRALWGYDSCNCPLKVERVRAEMAELA